MAETHWRTGRPDGPLSRLGILTIAATVVIDQVAKMLAEMRLPLGEAIDVLPILTLYRVHNTGIAFSMFAAFGSLTMILVMLAISAVVLALWLTTRDGGRLATLAYALIVGGAFGNLIDRLRLGEVIDFLLLHFGERTLFVFNLADAALTVGAALLVLLHLFPTPGE